MKLERRGGGAFLFILLLVICVAGAKKKQRQREAAEVRAYEQTHSELDAIRSNYFRSDEWKRREAEYKAQVDQWKIENEFNR